MKIGDYVTVQEIKDQSEARWVVLSDFEYRDYGDYEGIDGGIIRCIADTKREASKVSVKLHLSGTDTLLMSGAIEPLCLGGVFVE
ncbi:MAG: hypothetical protein FWF80_01185 [Defluviitaleaceae bacterium]|nr:hypothetical protein [Defluviitaleaceae bacterium]